MSAPAPSPPLPNGDHANGTHQWRSPPSQPTPLVEPSSLPGLLSPRAPSIADSPDLPQLGKNDLVHPSFLPPCEHSKDPSDMHAHAFDLLSLSGGPPSSTRPPITTAKSTATDHVVPSSVPAHTTSFLSATRPPVVNPVQQEKTGNGVVPPKARRMSSSTTGVLGRGKLGLTGDSGLVAKDVRGASYNTSSPIPNRRPTISNGSPTPQLFDFAKTDRRPSAISSHSTSAVPASLPTRNGLHNNAISTEEDDIEFDMEFDGDDDDEGEGSGRSGSADIDMDMEDDGEIKPEWEKLALGTGSGGLKGRRKGMVFKCESCGKQYRHPSCLVKHRWEHSPHWKEPNALSMSKHQQVQLLEAAAILAHLDPTAVAGRSLPNDKSLWPAILTPAGGDAPLRSSRGTREPSFMRSPPSSVIAPLTPSSLREPSSLGTLVERNTKERKSSPGSDSTTSSMGAGEPYIPRQQNGLGLRHNSISNGNGVRPSRPMGINGAGARRPSTSTSTSYPTPGTPQSIGSLPDMAGLHFHSHTGTTPAGSYVGSAGAGVSAGMSPIPHRGSAMPLPLYLKTGMVGGGMFGAINTSVRSSSVRSGAAQDDDEEEGDLEDVAVEKDEWRKRGSSSEKEKEEEWAGMAMEMEL